MELLVVVLQVEVVTLSLAVFVNISVRLTSRKASSKWNVRMF